jgi:hypothetical protein
MENRKSQFAQLVSVVALCAWAATAQGAVFVLSNGGRIEGQLLNPDQQPRQTYVVRTPSGGTVTLGQDQVDQVLTISEDLRWYYDALPKVAATVDDHWAMAEACKERGLKTQREFHLNEILKLDPEHQEAHYGLGHSKVDGRWVNADQWMRSRGYVRYRGAWRIPQDVALEQSFEKYSNRTKDWQQKVKSWRTMIAKRRGKEQEAIEAIQAIDDPAAAAALIGILENEREPRELRKLCAEVLGRLRTPTAVAAFVRIAIEDPDPHVREACLDQLVKFGAPAAVRGFQQMLESPDNRKVNRAAICLGELGAQEAALSLIEALHTEHKYKIQTGGGPGQMSLGFGGGAGGSGNTFGAGGRPKIVTRTLQNEGVLNALVAIFPGINFGYDQAAWKNWYTEQHRPPVGSLRRDD